jgi:hypothetical protein
MIAANRKDFYVYQTSVASLAAAASTSTTIAIEADSNFWLQKLTFNAVVGANGANLPTPNVLILITDTGSGRQLMNATIAVPALFGNGTLPFILPNPRLFRRNSTISFAWTSFEAAQAVSCRLDLIGYKEYGTD